MATRSETLKFRLSKQELAAIAALAQLEKLPTSTYVRRQLLLEAERRGITSRLEIADERSANITEAYAR
jgi:hypothetical protein